MLITLFNAPENRFRMSQLAETAVLTPSGLDLLGSFWRDLGLV